MCHLVARELHKVAAPFFMYIVQLYKEDWGILLMLGCRAVALPSTKQIVRKHKSATNWKISHSGILHMYIHDSLVNLCVKYKAISVNGILPTEINKK